MEHKRAFSGRLTPPWWRQT